MSSLRGDLGADELCAIDPRAVDRCAGELRAGRAGRGGTVARALIAAALLLCGCGETAQEAPLARSGRLGSLRDLVLFERADELGGPFFLDRFEVTRGDWRAFAGSPAGRTSAAPMPVIATELDTALPMADVDLAQSRAFAHWRCCRLPRVDEWDFACTAGDKTKKPYPWGANPAAARANTWELGLNAPTPVGTFESGRAGDGPYDLIGNVAEWTETVAGSWFDADREPVSAVAIARGRLARAPALATLSLPQQPWSAFLIVQAAAEQAPREVLGSDYASGQRDRAVARGPRDRASTIGVRLCSTPRELLVALAAAHVQFDADDLRQWRRFVVRPGHREVLRAAFAELRDGGALDAAAQAWLQGELS